MFAQELNSLHQNPSLPVSNSFYSTPPSLTNVKPVYLSIIDAFSKSVKSMTTVCTQASARLQLDGFPWNLICRETPYLVKIGQNVRLFAYLPKYVLLLPVIINRHKSAVGQRNGIGLLGQQKRNKHYANAPQCYDKPTLPILCIMRWGTEEMSPGSTAPVERLTVERVTIKFPSLYGIHKFITMLTNSPHEIPFLSQMNPVHDLASYFLKINFNIICPPKLHLSSCLLLAVYPTKTQSAASLLWSFFHICRVSAGGPEGGSRPDYVAHFLSFSVVSLFVDCTM